MSALGKKLRRLEGGFVAFCCPGCSEAHRCSEAHQVRVEGEGGPRWGFNGSGDEPTFTPSILVRSKQLARDAEGRWTGEWIRGPEGEALDHVCHSFVTDGRIQFLGDCTHALAGQTVDLPDWPS